MLMRNTLILYGPPGTGKSTLAEIFAKQSIGVSPVVLNAPNLVTVEQGSGVANINNTFEAAKRSSSPTVIIIEEVDSIADSWLPFKNNEEQRAIYQALNTQIDSIKENHKIFVICTTNYIERCASEFLSRFEQVKIGPLSEQERISALRIFFFNNDSLTADIQTVHHIVEQLVQKAPLHNKNDLQAIGETIDKIEDSFQKLPLTHYDTSVISTIKAYRDSVKHTIEAYHSDPAFKISQTEQEVAAINLLISLLDTRLNIYDFVMKPNSTFAYLVHQMENKSLRFIKYFSMDVIAHAHQYQNGYITKKLITALIEKYRERLNQSSYRS